MRLKYSLIFAPEEVKVSKFEKVQFINVTAAGDGQRLDNFLIRHLKGVPRSRIYRLIRRGEVRVNKKRSKPVNKLSLGDSVRLPPISMAAAPKTNKPGAELVKRLLESVLFENDDLLVINKPAGFSVHGGSGIRLGLIEAFRQIKPEWRTLELAHRLDRDTSGCLVICKNSIYLKYLHSEFKAKSVEKHYLAVVHGYWPDSLCEVDAPLLKNELASGERIVKVDNTGKASKTRFELIKRFTKATLVKALPETGRTHQIRVHCQHVGHPIVGDSKYTSRTKVLHLPVVKHLCLHASKISFIEPQSGVLLSFEAELDPQLAELLKALT
jgi:23S rRNA pseudouridine955/2504/2580 synthase